MKYSIETINEELSQYGWKCISETYSNLDSELIFTCDEEHTVYSSWKKIRQKRECPICKKNKLKQPVKVFPKKRGEYRVLGLDQATYISGWSIYDNKKLKAYGTFEATGEDEIDRCIQVKNWLINMVDTWQIDCVGIEGIQYQQYMGVVTFQTLARLQGIIMECCHELGIKYKVCPTNTWRSHCGVKGKSRPDKKRSMQLLAKEWFDVTLTEDEADAVGIGKYTSDKFSPVLKITNWE